MSEQSGRTASIIARGLAFGVAAFVALVCAGVLTSAWDRLDTAVSTSSRARSATAPALATGCDEPIGWYIADIDPQFDISRNDARRAAERAVDVWEDVLPDRALFVHDPAGTLPISLEYDATLNELHRRRLEYNRAMNAYNDDVDAYNRRLEAYERRVEAWNRSPGSQSEHDAIERQRRALEREKRDLRRRASELDDMRPRRSLEEFQTGRYEQTLEYDSQTGDVTAVLDRAVMVYQFDDADDLALTIAHELGHALGIEHLDDPTAVMHPTPSRPAGGEIRATRADRLALREVCAATAGAPASRRGQRTE